MSLMSKPLPEAGYFSDVPNEPLVDGQFFATLMNPAIKINSVVHIHSFEHWLPEDLRDWHLKICKSCGLFRLYDRTSEGVVHHDKWLSENLLSKLKMMKEISIRWHKVGYDRLAFYLSESETNFTVYPISKINKNTKYVKTYFAYKKVDKK